MPLLRGDHHDSRALMASRHTMKLVENRPPLRGWAVFSLCALVMACGPSPEAETTQDSMPDTRPSQVVLEGYFEYTERGRVVQSLEAAKLERWESPESAEETPDVWHVDGGFTLYIGGTQARHNAKLSAVRGTYDDEAGRLEAWEEVVLVNEEGERLETEHLIWSHDSDLVRTDRPVAIHSAQGVLRGRGLTSDSRFERYEILSPTGSFDLGMEDTAEEER